MRQDARDDQFSEYVAAHRARFVRTARLLTVGDQEAAEDLVTDQTPDGAETRAGQEARSMVLAALHTLPARQRAVVVLRHFLQYNVAATAEALGCSEGTVKSQNAKALGKLRHELGEPSTTEGPHR